MNSRSAKPVLMEPSIWRMVFSLTSLLWTLALSKLNGTSMTLHLRLPRNILLRSLILQLLLLLRPHLQPVPPRRSPPVPALPPKLISRPLHRPLHRLLLQAPLLPPFILLYPHLHLMSLITWLLFLLYLWDLASWFCRPNEGLDRKSDPMPHEFFA